MTPNNDHQALGPRSREPDDELNNRSAELNRVNNDLVNLLGSVQTAIVMLGPDLRVRRFTPAAEKMLNLIPPDVGRPFSDIKLNLDNLPDLEPLLTEVLDTDSTKEREVRDQHGRWYSLRLRPYKTLDNKIDGVVVMLVDVDVIKRAHEYTASIVATVREPLLVLDAELRVRTASRSFYQTFRVAPEEAQGRLLYELANGQWNIPELRRLLEEVLPQDHHFNDFEVQREFEHIGKRTMLLNARRLLQPGEHSPSILLAIEDVTERKRQADELRQYAADLSESDRRKNEFLAMLAHELRNPLAPIRNALQIVRLTKGNEKAVQPALEMMERQVGQIALLVDDLLDVSRISHGNIELRTSHVELTSVVNHAAEAVRPLCENMGHELTVTLPRQPVYLNGDQTRLAQVVGNLLNNACKFTDRGGRIWLTVSVKNMQTREGSVSRSPPEAVIRVRDNGIGLAADDLPGIFEMFTQVDSSLERSASGLGIGLTLVKKLVEMHDGTVEVHSAGLGQGSEFVVRLPILVETPQPPPPEPTVSEPPPTTPRRILVVDDNRDSAESLAELLRLTGHETHTAHDGHEAVAAAATLRPDVVLLDIGMPKMNGYEAARCIREQPWGKDMVLVALTGWAQDEDRRKSKEAGFDGHLVKPVDHAALTKLLAELPPTPVGSGDSSKGG